MIALTACLVALSLGVGCSSRGTSGQLSEPTSAPPAQVSTVPASGGASPQVDLAHLKLTLSKRWAGFSSPLYLTSAHDGSGRLFVVEQGGLVKVIEGGAVLPTPYLDVRALVSTGGERGLLGMAFSPRFARDGAVYIDYTDVSGNTVVARYTAPDPASSSPTWETPRVILTVAQPYPNHNGGCLQFGPDGYLYIGMGDGGSHGDPGGRAQNRAELLGKILRIDVSHAAGGKPYAIPPTNPYNLTRSSTLRPAPEVWALGLRNPWRFTFDTADSSLWIADVGQDAWEEIDHVAPAAAAAAEKTGGLNLGWATYEGDRTYPAGTLVPTADRSTAYLWPVLTYPHPTGESITGGYVYRGAHYPAMRGTYLYADYVMGWVGGLRITAPDGTPLAAVESQRLLSKVGNPSSFGVDENDELYLVDYRGAIYQVGGSAK